ncbi:hypothetical protein SASPL_131593 [Salvia splendens]|uniref:Protein kinase domain-containing protein n=1 Tax=Salvia splendens TaxID=180675 RepID=A0A8X8X919_SALSN|nr:hypothetical protein SASPL_131593 [Salvia splendens]
MVGFGRFGSIYKAVLDDEKDIVRLNIALDIAHGIKYLHFGSYSSIIHGDLKLSNILLDHDMVACVGDFGLAKIASNILSFSYESNTSSFGIKGTLGYVPPENPRDRMPITLVENELANILAQLQPFSLEV